MADVVQVQVTNTVTGTVTQVQTVDVGYSLPAPTGPGNIDGGTAATGQLPAGAIDGGNATG